ncbi:hypothetical protein Efla_006138 [Eimeria flavescens]
MPSSIPMREQHHAGELELASKESSFYKTTSQDFAPLLNVSDVSNAGGSKLAKFVDRQALIGRLHHRRLAEGCNDNDDSEGGRTSPGLAGAVFGDEGSGFAQSSSRKAE